jgi:putative nucleotidyltransferase-like protein
LKIAAQLLKNHRDSARAERGKLVAQLLAGSWRSAPPQPLISTLELAEIATLLLRTHAGALGWWRIRHTALRANSAGEQLQHAYRYDSLQAALHERSLKQVIPMLQSYGVEPLVLKGWAIARHYPDPGLRHYCDIDLCVLPGQFTLAERTLRSQRSPEWNVDLHPGFGKFNDRQTEDVFSRSQLVSLDGVEVRVPSAEDHLRFLCMHLLRHGVARPLWLCDLGVLLERRPSNFDWDRCLGTSRQQADWIACALGLAHQLVGAEVDGTPIARRAKKLPSWLVPVVLKEWGTSFKTRKQVGVYLRHPARVLRGLLRELPRHWPNPIEATMTWKGPFNELPRLPFQVGHVVSRTTAMLAQLSTSHADSL